MADLFLNTLQIWQFAWIRGAFCLHIVACIFNLIWEVIHEFTTLSFQQYQKIDDDLSIASEPGAESQSTISRN